MLPLCNAAPSEHNYLLALATGCLIKSLNLCRIRGEEVFRHEERGPLEHVDPGRQEPVPGDRLHRRGRHLPPHGRHLSLRSHQIRKIVSI